MNLKEENLLWENLISVANINELKDGCWEGLKKEGCFGIYLKKNSFVELDFVGEQMMNENVSQLVENIENEHFTAIRMLFFKEFQLGRFFLRKLSPQIEEGVVVYISNGDKVYKIQVSDYMRNFVQEQENFLDLCILCKDEEKGTFEEFVFLVPMEQEITSITGLFEINHLVSFVSNSKFDVSKFFGFELESDLENKNCTLSKAEAIENLKNYEIGYEGNYLINSV